MAMFFKTEDVSVKSDLPSSLARNNAHTQDILIDVPNPTNSNEWGGRNSEGGILGLNPNPSLLQSGFSNVPAPKDIIDFGKFATNYYYMYKKAAYYFYNCSIFGAAITRLVNETLRNGIELAPKFGTKCPSCSTEYKGNIKQCRSCGYTGEMNKPDASQKKYLVNWRGESIVDCVNKNQQDLLALTREYLYNALIFGQPIVLCKSLYAINPYGEIIQEIPNEFLTLSPLRAYMVFDLAGEPGDNIGFTLDDRHTQRQLLDTSNPGLMGFTKEGKKIYPTHWIISNNDGGEMTNGDQYNNSEIYHDPYDLPTRHYGVPKCVKIELALQTWIAIAMRKLKLYNTGHPQGIFVMNNVTDMQVDTLLQTMKMKMQGDPYSVPVLNIAPGNTSGTNSAKWIPFMTNPTQDMADIESGLLQNIAAEYGINGLFLGDTKAMKGNSNEQQQASVMDRNLQPIRDYVNKFLKWITFKFRWTVEAGGNIEGVTDWIFRIKEPPDDSEAKDWEIRNLKVEWYSKMVQLGFTPIYLDEDGNVELSSTPQAGATTMQSLTGMLEDNPKPFMSDEPNDFSGNLGMEDVSGETGDA